MTSLLSKYDVQLQDSMQKQTDLVSDTTDGLAAVRSPHWYYSYRAK